MVGAKGTQRGRKRSSVVDGKENCGKKAKANATESVDKVGSGRDAAQGINYKEVAHKETADDKVSVVEVAECDAERDALEQTGELKCKERRLQDFQIQDDRGELQPLAFTDSSGGPLTISGIIQPAKGPISRKTGRVVQNFAVVEKWDVLYSKTEANVRIWTGNAMYSCVRPSQKYKAMFTSLMDQANICLEVLNVVNPQRGGNAEVSLDAALVKLARSKMEHGYSGWREAILLNGSFILSQFKAETERIDDQRVNLSECQLAIDLEKECGADQCMTRNGGISIGSGVGGSGVKGKEADTLMTADEEFARRLQAKEEAKAQNGAGNARKNSKQAYIRISEEEIAHDYPLPAQYEKEEDEMDELLMADECCYLEPEDLPQRILTDFAIYNSEGFFATLELLPGWSGIDPDVELYGSGIVKEEEEDDPWQKDWSSGFADAGGSGAGGSGAGGSGAGGSGAGGSGAGGSGAGGSSCPGGSSSAAGGGSSAALEMQDSEPHGIRTYLSQIKEWVVECGFDTVTISLRTEACWYKLDLPHETYAPWFNVVHKCARVAVKIIGMITEETRVSRLSFAAVVKRLAEQDKSSDSYISKDESTVRQYVTVHGQIISDQLKNFPVEKVKKSAFAVALLEQMEMRRHFKLYMPKKKTKKASRGGKAVRTVVNKNPMKDRAANNIRAKSMPATATRLVQDIWQHYFFVPENQLAEIPEADKEEVNDEEELGAEADLTQTPAGSKAKSKSVTSKKPVATWIGQPLRTDGKKKLYEKASFGDLSVDVGCVVELGAGVGGNHTVGLIQSMWEKQNGQKVAQVRLMMMGRSTVLGDTASEEELFLTTDLVTTPLDSIKGVLKAGRLTEKWGPKHRREQLANYNTLREKNESAASDGSPIEYFYRSLYLPDKGMFCEAPADLGFNSISQQTSDDKAEAGAVVIDGGRGIRSNGEEYREGDFLYVDSTLWDPLVEAPVREVPDYAAKGGRGHKGSSRLMQPFGIGRLVRVLPNGQKTFAKNGKASKVEVMRFYRPEDVQLDLAYTTSFWDVFASKDKFTIDVASIAGKCKVVSEGQRKENEIWTYECTHSVKSAEPAKLLPPPAEFRRSSKEDLMDIDESKPQEGIELKTLDIFAGCGGLSEGLHQAGAAVTKWAVEYDDEAARACQENNPDAAIFCNNSSVILRRAMAEHSYLDDCCACDAAIDQANKMPSERAASLPAPGDVDFICGGPPCQGYSGMNRFNKGTWSLMQNSMVINFLSFADFYRPRFFLLENVRAFVSHNKSKTFRLAVRSLLDMGYQVRFGVLNAGNYGVPQSRKRTFIWGAAPGEKLPDWPAQMHVFSSPQLTITLPGGIKYVAVPNRNGAPLRTVTVKDAIGDLPPIKNGEDRAERSYDSEAKSAFQKEIRKGSTVLRDHIAKRLSDLNLERCKCIPKNVPGADWRVLQEIVAKDPSREKFKGQPLVPWCLPNTADRHNGWRGLFGRLDVHGHFPTSTTDPQPMGKVGQVFHPDQDRIVSVRECARSQGFPDNFRFTGTVHQKHRQVGNAVPPPLARALGRELRKSLEWKAAAHHD
ncbi:hypothetical protein BSKO_00932 [Bryopsis sp. KO-2023]|nr:hypothetical protein BSKO_00932 [Bryopsis sp. KO-2023]